MYFRTKDGRNLYYEWQGNLGSSEVLIFLNGLTQSTLSWALMIPYFEKKYRILLLDFIFQGQSDKEGSYKTFDEHARDVLDLCRYEKVEKPVIVGLSYGSLVAQHIGVHEPGFSKKFFLLSTFAKKNPYFEAIELSWWRGLQTGGYDLLLDIMMPFVLSEEYFKNPVIPIETLKSIRREVNQNKEALLNLMQATRERYSYLDELKNFKDPVVIIHGQKDTLIPVFMGMEVHHAIPRSEFIIVPDTGHTLNLENVPWVAKKILENI